MSMNDFIDPADLPPHWIMRKEVDGVPCQIWWERSDGAYVWKDTDNYWARPWLAGHRSWTAIGPDDRYLYFVHRGKYHESKVLTPRKWKTAMAALRALDKERPMAIIKTGDRKTFQYDTP